MAYYDIKEIKFAIKSSSGSVMHSSYRGSVGFKRPESQFEAQKMATEWLKKQYPNYEIVDLEVTLK